MAPRGRSARGETRMDAALDAMSLYGFPNKLVRQTVSQLLKVYGGNDGWVFIEDSAYTLLIDTLLEQQQQTLPLPQPQDCLIEDGQGNGPNEASPASCSNSALLPCSNTEDSDDVPSTNQAVDTISAASEPGNQLPLMAMDTASVTNKTANELPIKPIGTSSATSELSNQLSIKVVDTTVSATGENDNQALIMVTDTVSAYNESESPQTKLAQPLGRLCHKRRKPCFGWISSDDDEEEEELIELPPGPLCNAFYKLVSDGVN